jgi:hypothetical protein
LTVTDQIRAAARTSSTGEAALTVACHARSPADALHLLDLLGISRGAAYRWDCARVAAAALRYGRLGEPWSAATLRGRLPARAHRMVPRAVANLATAGLAEPTGDVTLSQSPGARGRKVPVYRLTRTGEDLAMEIAPLPGFGDRALASLV